MRRPVVKQAYLATMRRCGVNVAYLWLCACTYLETALLSYSTRSGRVHFPQSCPVRPIPFAELEIKDTEKVL